MLRSFQPPQHCIAFAAGSFGVWEDEGGVLSALMCFCRKERKVRKGVGMGRGVSARPLAAPSGFALRAQATRRLPARANGARPRNAAGLSCGVPPPERARQRVGQKVAWMLHPVTLVTTRERPSPRAAASFRPSAHDKPQRHENHLRGARKRPLRGLHEKHEILKGRLRRGTRKRQPRRNQLAHCSTTAFG